MTIDRSHVDPTDKKYVMVEKTRAALVQVNDNLDVDNLNEHELKAALLLLKECAKFINHYGEDILGFADNREEYRLRGIAKSVQMSVRSLLGDDAIEEVLGE